MKNLNARLEEVLDAYGASPQRWPENEREELLTFVEGSARARSLVETAARLDDWMDAASPMDGPSPDLADRIVAAANSPSRRSSSKNWRWAAVIPLAAAAALALWIQNTNIPAPEPAQELALAELGIYETPTDILLEVDGFDPLTGVPSYDCNESDLGCLELETDPSWFQQQSIQGGARRIFT